MAEETRPKWHFEENNTEGDYPVAFRADNAELKKGERIVATELNDLYDCDIETTPPNDEDYLGWDAAQQLWVPMEPQTGGAGCTLVTGSLILYVYTEIVENVSGNRYIYDYSNPNGNHPDGSVDPQQPIGSYLNPFASVNDALDWLTTECKSIKEDARVNIIWMHTGDYFLFMNIDTDVDPADAFFVTYPTINPRHPSLDRVFIYAWDVTTGAHITNQPEIDDWESNFPTLTVKMTYAHDGYWPPPGDTPEEEDEWCYAIDTSATKFLPLLEINSGSVLGGFYNVHFDQADGSPFCYDDGGS